MLSVKEIQLLSSISVGTQVHLKGSLFITFAVWLQKPLTHHYISMTSTYLSSY